MLSIAVSRPESKKGGRPPVPVLVAAAEQADVPVELRAIGTVEPIQSSPVRSPVTGTLTGVLFQEGDLVREAQVLFTIDPRPIEATLRQLQANLLRDEAQVKNAEAQTNSADAQVKNAEAQLANAASQARRYKDLMEKDLISREQHDQRMTNLDAARSAIDNAYLQKEQTVIRSPVSGQTGSLLAERGDLVKANDATLLIVNQLHPILVLFTVPERLLPEVQRYRKEGTLMVRVTPPGSGQVPREGSIVFLDNTVDRTTGTIALKARFDNHDSALWPGQFADVSLVLTTREKAVVVPSAAVQTGQQGSYVFVVEADGTASVRPVSAGQSSGGKTLIETTLLMAAILLFGIMGYRALPVSDLPNVDFPTVQVRASLPGADPKTMASAVATPLEKAFSTIAGIDSMTSSSSQGSTTIVLTFNLDRDIDSAAQDVQAAIARTQRHLPRDILTPSYQKVNPADDPILYLALTSQTLPLSTVSEYGENLMAQRISMVQGVAAV